MADPSRAGRPRGAMIAREYGRARAAAQAAGAKYNRLIRFLKLLLPGVAAVLVGAVVAWPLLSPRGDRIPLGYSSVSKEEIDQLRMINPRYVGIDGRNQPFAVTADSAKQIEAEAGVVQLDQPKADITLQNGTWIALTAATGTFTQKRQFIQLTESVSLFHDAGYEFRTASAEIDLAAGTAVGTSPVEGQGPFGSLKSEGFRILDKGDRVIFTGRATLVMYRLSAQAPTPAGKR